MSVDYRPYAEREVALQYRNLVQTILMKGTAVMPQQDEMALMILGHQMRFDLRNGFPMITERTLYERGEQYCIFNQALGELFAFLSGARTQKELERFGCRWWKPWVTKEKCEKRGLEEGDLGPGSYGPAWRNFPLGRGGPGFDQITHLIEQIKDLPHLRTHFVSPWTPQYIGRGKGKQQKVAVAPCHGWLHFIVYPATREISLHHFQRSADVPVGLCANLIQYGALLMMAAQVTGYRARELVYTLSDAHIYQSQIEDARKIINTEPQRLPTVQISLEAKNLFDFRQEHFAVSDYHPQLPAQRIPTPV